MAETQAKEEHVHHLKSRYDTLKSATERSNFETQWQQIGEVVSPRKIDFVGIRTPGEKRMSQVYDPTGIISNELLAAGLHGMATNPAMKWFSLRLVSAKIFNQDGSTTDINEIPPIQKWLAHVEEVMWQRVYQPGTNFTTALHETYLDLGAFGTAIMFVGQRDDGGLLFESRPLSECVIDENVDGKVDTVYRKTTYTVRQMIQMTKQEGWKVSDKVMDLFKAEKFDETVVVIHAVYPRSDRDVKKKNTENMPFASCYFEHDTGHLLRESGFPEFPYLVARWSKYAGEKYGRGPGMTALPDIRMLQAMSLTYIKTVQKNADPPIALSSDGLVGAVRTIPGGVTYFRGNPSEGMMQFPTSVQGLGHMAEFMEQVRNRIRNCFFVDVLQMVGDAEMTATEVMQRTAERMRLLGPLVGRLESELLGPMVDRIFGILMRMKLLPEPPKEIQGQEFTVEYVSPVATAQKQQAINGIMQAMQVISAFGPEVAVQIAGKNLDVDKLFRWSWDLFNNNPELLRDEEAMARDDQMQKAKQALEMGQPAMDMAAQGAGAVKSVADAAAAGQGAGFDVKALLGQVVQNVKNSPKAQQELADMGKNVMQQAGMPAQ